MQGGGSISAYVAKLAEAWAEVGSGMSGVPACHSIYKVRGNWI
jgi:hypothetical protein